MRYIDHDDLELEEGRRPSAESEQDRIMSWRFEEFRRAGYSEEAALIMAIDPEVDLHVATDLIRRGCSFDTALQILL